MKKSELRQIIREEIQKLNEAAPVHADFGKYLGDLTDSKTIWLYPKKGAYDFKKEIVILKKAFGKAKVTPHEMDSVELVFSKPIPSPKEWANALK